MVNWPVLAWCDTDADAACEPPARWLCSQDQYERAILNLYVTPSFPVVSYLTALTGLTKDVLDQHGMPLEAALGVRRQHLPRNAVLVGQNISKDVQWLHLQEGQDFASMMDLTGL